MIRSVDEDLPLFLIQQNRGSIRQTEIVWRPSDISGVQVQRRLRR
jgi:hypothetical protein